MTDKPRTWADVRLEAIRSVQRKSVDHAVEILFTGDRHGPAWDRLDAELQVWAQITAFSFTTNRPPEQA